MPDAVKAGQAVEAYDDDDLALADGELVDGPARPAVYKVQDLAVHDTDSDGEDEVATPKRRALLIPKALTLENVEEAGEKLFEFSIFNKLCFW